MIEKGKYNIYDNKGNERHIQAIRNNVRQFHELTSDPVIYLGIDMDLGKDVVFCEDNFPNVVAIYEGVGIRSTDGNSISSTRSVNPFGYILNNSRTVLLNIDSFYNLTKKHNENIPELAGRNWIPRNGDIIISTLYDEIYKVNEVSTTETEQRLADRNTFTLTLVPHSIKNLSSKAIDLDDLESLENGTAIKQALDNIFGTTQVNNSTGEVEEIDKHDNSQDVKKEIYQLNENGEVILDADRKSILGEF